MKRKKTATTTVSNDRYKNEWEESIEKPPNRERITKYIYYTQLQIMCRKGMHMRAHTPTTTAVAVAVDASQSAKMKCECAAASKITYCLLLTAFQSAFFESLFCYIIIIMCFHLRISNRVQFFSSLYIHVATESEKKNIYIQKNTVCLHKFTRVFSIYRILWPK